MDEDPWGIQAPSAVAGEAPPLPARFAPFVDLAARGESRVLEPGERLVLPSVEELPEELCLDWDLPGFAAA